MAAFDSVEQIADAKAEIFEGIAPGGAAILNRDNAYFDRLAQAARAANAHVIAFGAADDADARLESARVTSAATVVKASLNGRPLVFKIGAPGRHLAMNALAALAAVDAVGGDLSNKDGMRAAMKKADYASVRGKYTYGNNHFPIQNFYLRETYKNDAGEYTVKTVQTVFENHQDPYAADCKM